MKAALLDIDGTTLLGRAPLPGAEAVVRWLRAESIPLLWITNNTSRSRGAWLERLAAAGMEPSPDELYTAGDATIDWLGALDPTPPLYLVGTRDLEADFRAAGLPVAPPAEAEMVVLAYDTELTYEKLSTAALLLRRGVRYVATHPDVNCPTPDGPIPDVGSFMALLEASCGRRPEVIGKPHATMVEGALGRLGVSREDAVLVGDRLETDMRMAHEAGIRGMLVLTGVTTRAEAERSRWRPPTICASLIEVHDLLR